MNPTIIKSICYLLINSTFVYKQLGCRSEDHIYHSCSVPERITHGTVSALISATTTNLKNDETVLILCADGYEAYPKNVLTCAEFNTLKPECIEIAKNRSSESCGELKYIENGVVEDLAGIGKVVWPNANLIISCNDGFEPFPDHIFTCDGFNELKPQCIEIADNQTTSMYNCSVPDIIQYGEVSPLNSEYSLEDLPSNEKVVITCADGFKAYPKDILQCEDFQKVKPQCIKTCPSVEPTSTAEPTCKFLNKNTSCTYPYEGTTAIFQCINHYENRHNDLRAFTCKFGKWTNVPKYECEPVCGIRNAQPEQLLIGGEDSDLNEFPWHIGVYKNKNYFNIICGGVIITPKISLSAAHCFEPNRNAKSFLVGAGKTFNDYYNPNDNNAQYSNLSHILIPTSYSSASDSLSSHDLAVLILENPFIMNTYVLPACLDSNSYFNNDLLANSTGIVTGWGFTKEKGAPAERLKVLEVNYETKDTCVIKFDFRKYYFPNVQDKICAGHRNKGKSACKGDSGGGLVFANDDDHRYYVRGIVSITPLKLGGCDSSHNSLYTSIAYHLPFIKDQIAKYNVERISKALNIRNIIKYEGGCILPVIKNGEWTMDYRGVENITRKLKPHEMAPLYTRLTIDCAAGYDTFPTNFQRTTTCFTGKWSDHIECKKFCSNLLENPGLKSECYFNEKKVIDCLRPYDGTVAKVTCNKHYEKVDDIIDPYRYCIDGVWSDKIPNCRPKCGLDFDDIENKGVDEFAHRERFPWHVSIIDHRATVYICAGSLITTKFVVTSFCFNKPYSNHMVTARHQFANLFLENYNNYARPTRAIKTVYLDDVIAKTYILEIDDLEINHFVQPACFQRHQGHPIYNLGDMGYFIDTKINNTDMTYDKVEFIFRENEYCNTTWYEYPHRDTDACVEIIGNPSCDNIEGSGVIFPAENGKHYMVGVIDDEINCNSKYVILRLVTKTLYNFYQNHYNLGL